ncbi:MAG: dienelactone hydrolase family protein [Bacteroidetes bacterium]|nr:dienelactone hydrolase family protein [Bacteroidota bacterium]MBS1630842.1 dienelactone hydrolase family protein [Bacteroidota bacterium]
MKKNIALLSAAVFFSACGAPGSHSAAQTDDSPNHKISTQVLNYESGGQRCQSFAAFDSSWKEPHPVVLVLPEWWGLNDYPRSRARQLAGQGYFALAVDLYGAGKTTENPEEAGRLAKPFYGDTALVKQRLLAALQALRTLPQADANQVGIVGYCFGGSMGLLAAKMQLPVRGVVSIHGGLKGTAGPTNIPILVCQGGADQFVGPADVSAWRKTMDSLGVAYTFNTYPGATHAFSNPASTETGKRLHLPIEYNAAADRASWQAMLTFFKQHLR